jgi:hypothetical protein
MLKKFTYVYVDGEQGEWVITGAWVLDEFQRKEAHATYGYEVRRDKRLRIAYDTQVMEIK